MTRSLQRLGIPWQAPRAEWEGVKAVEQDQAGFDLVCSI
jgi:hypothetical protein